MLKLLFNFFTSPLGLPIDTIWEYLILAVIGAIAFMIGWDASPGGRTGSAIHWVVRFVAFLVLWAVTYALIALVKWLFTNWVLVLCILGGVILVSFVAYIVIRCYRKKQKEQAGGIDEKDER